MKANMTKQKGQVYSVGNYLMTGKVLGKGHFAKVEEATHRIIGKKVAIKIIDLTCIKEEYARRNLHREPRVMAKLRHPCIAALYETMMHGPRLYVVMEGCGGGDLCAHVLAAGAGGRAAGAGGGGGAGARRGLPEPRARPLAAQLVSAVRHMHSRGVVHRDLKMENIMLDGTKQFIKIVDFGLSNVWSANGALRTPCGSLEYAAPELFVDGRRYGPEVDLWSIGVIVYGMVTGGLPFTGGEGGDRDEGRSRPQLRAAITRGFGRKQRTALTYVSAECKAFIQQLLEPNVDNRMKIEEAAKHRWIKKSGMRMKTHPMGNIEPRINREIYRQISELSGQPIMDIVAQIKAEPFGIIAGMYNIKTHVHQLQNMIGTDSLWSSINDEMRPPSPPDYKNINDKKRPESSCAKTLLSTSPSKTFDSVIQKANIQEQNLIKQINTPKIQANGQISNRCSIQNSICDSILNHHPQIHRDLQTPKMQLNQTKISTRETDKLKTQKSQTTQSPRFVPSKRPVTIYGLKKPVYKVYDSGDCGLDRRLPCINEHSNIDLNDGKKGGARSNNGKPCIRRTNLEEPIRLNSCPNRVCDLKRNEFYRRAGDGVPSWRTCGVIGPTTRILLQNNATGIQRASLGNIVSPHSSSNGHCKSERALPVGWCSGRNSMVKESTHLQRLRRTAPMK